MISIKIDTDGFADRLAKAATEAAKKQLKEKIEAVRCPVHHQRAQAVLKSGSGLDYEIRGCCDELTKAVRKSLGAK